jgi:hypothetical protein
VAALGHYERAAEVVAPVEARLRAEIERVHGAAWVAAWDRGLPTYVDVPGEVNVQEILRLWHFAKALDLTDWGSMRYNLMGNAGHWFPGNNAAGIDAAAIRAELGDHPFAARIPEILAEAHAMLHGKQQKRLSEGG